MVRATRSLARNRLLEVTVVAHISAIALGVGLLGSVGQAVMVAISFGNAGAAATAEPKEGAQVTQARPDVGAVFSDCPKVCPEMVVLPPGQFDRGAPYVHADPPPAYTPPETVVIDKPFAIGRYDVTVGQYEAFVRATRPTDIGNCRTDRGTVGPFRLDPQGSWRDPGFPQDERHPVVCVTVADAKAYAAWLSKKTGRRYRLPTQKEWEYAARAGATEDSIDPSPGDESLCRYANIQDARYKAKYPGALAGGCDDGHANTSPVGSYPPNRFGLYDIVGNVAQWTDTEEPGGTGNTAAGGSWSTILPVNPLSAQPAYDRNMRRPWIGFRLVRELR